MAPALTCKTRPAPSREEHPERWPSGLRRTLGKRVCGKPYRGFESHSLRHVSRSHIFSARLCMQLSPTAATISRLGSALLFGRARLFFSEMPIYLRSSGLREFG